MIEINYNRALELLNDQIVAKGSDYVYPFAKSGKPCVNVELVGDDYCPSCIVGGAYVSAGVNPAVFEELDIIGSDSYDVASSLEEAGIARTTDRAKWLLRQAQSLQDTGTSWGESVVEALEYISSIASYKLRDARKKDDFS